MSKYIECTYLHICVYVYNIHIQILIWVNEYLNVKFIVFLNPKGGSDKITATINVSTYLANASRYILVIDTDP